ncbi:MAG: hypothetical protein KIS76_02840 [Pyrinomonadaceae bacterium]|nr:hypothetical protein [Pyrinomonadaceae bacterium]
MKLKLQTLVIFSFFGFFAIVFVPKFFITNAGKDSVVSDDMKSTENRLPEIMDLHHKEIGLGQRWFFGLEVIDEEGDLVRAELVEKPKSAKFNQNTLTVDWTPQKSDGKNPKFVVKVTEIPRDKSREQRTVTKEFKVKVVKKPVQLLKMPDAPLEVDALVTIIDPDRLKAVSEKWNISNLFQRIAEIEAEKQVKPGSGIQKTDGRELFKDALKDLAITHKNPTLDPDDPKYNAEWNAEHWKLIAVRPRVNKKVFELRLVYFNVKAPEQAYLMPRMRIVRGKDSERPEETRLKNNETFLRLFHEAFFDGENLKPFVAKDKVEYGRALNAFVTKVLTYNDKDDPMMRANLAAIPHNSRLGGGNEYDENGKYLYGDGWLLGEMKVIPVMKNGKNVLTMTSTPFEGFVSSIKANKDGTSYTAVPAPAADRDDPNYRKGWEKLIDKSSGNLAIPKILADNSVVPNNIDTTLNKYETPGEFRFAETSLRDARRRIFEEKGMTCAQCHIRNFDEGNYLTDMRNPKKNPNDFATNTVERVFFIITPTLHSGRNEYMRRGEIEQVGSLQGAFRDYLGIDVKINSPLAADWVHDTKKGKN